MLVLGVASSTRLSHHNKQKAITIKANLSDGYTLGEALDFMDSQAIEMLPGDISVSYAGESKDFKENQSCILVVFGLALLVAYLVLAAQFESFRDPFIILAGSVPLSMAGALVFSFLGFTSMIIYSQVGLVTLVGLVAKNGILIVEFANQLRDKGLSLEQAIIDASARRLRPILMTAFTTLIGAIPLILSTGAGSESRIAVGTVVFFGMAFATLVTLLVIPAMYRLISGATKSPGFVEQQLNLAIEQQKASASKS